MDYGDGIYVTLVLIINQSVVLFTQ
jgi:hypothetical protein